MIGAINIFPEDILFNGTINRLRVFILRLFGAKIGKGCIINRCFISYPWNLSLGDYSWIGSNVQIYSYVSISIGSNVCISQQAFITSGGHQINSDSFNLIVKKITIKNGVWIGAKSFINPGVTIEEGVVVSACAVVTKSLNKYSIYSGIPARYISPRPLYEN